jgi:hypothetical protein
MRITAYKRAALIIAVLLAVQAQALAADPPVPQEKPVLAPAPSLPSAHEMDAASGNSAIPAASWFPILPFDAAPDAEPQLLPVASNLPLDSNHANITRAIIVIHDVSRDASSAVAMLATLAGEANKTTFILAPQFLLESDIARFAGHLPDNGRNVAHWAAGAWEDGGNSIAAAPDKDISSFTAIDLLLVFLSDRKLFPSLKDIVVAGHGAGGDFVLRYAAIGLAPDLINPGDVAIQFVAANPSSYLYFTPMRPAGGDKSGFGLPSTDRCPHYDSYKYGLDSLNDYARRTGANAIRLRYIDRRVTYMIGENAAGDDRFPDNNCAAMLEGIDRHARAINYDLYLSTIFGDDANKTQKSAGIPSAGYDPVAMFGSSCGMSVLFGDGNCAALTNVETPQ